VNIGIFCLPNLLLENPKLSQKKGVIVSKLQLKITITHPLIFFLSITAKGNIGKWSNIFVSTTLED
jgi:hypothetical protein